MNNQLLRIIILIVLTAGQLIAYAKTLEDLLSINISEIEQTHYFYDAQYRLTEAYGDRYKFRAAYSSSGRLGRRVFETTGVYAEMMFGYDAAQASHQPRNIYDTQNGAADLFWDTNGNLAQVILRKQNAARFHEWDEENRLRFVLGEKFAGYYGYDANGERVYKLTGTSSIDQVNSGYTKAQVVLDDAVLYPNPYIVLTPKGYTKHYYAGTERLATSIGGGGLGVQDTAWSFIDKPTQDEEEKAKMFYRAYGNRDPFMQQGLLSDTTQTVDIGGDKREELVYRGEAVMLDDISLLNKRDMLYYAIHDNAKINNPEKRVFYYHTDHLGSANWITETNGIPIQYIRYAPFGELLLNEIPGGYDERYKFTGKERDTETGYDYFGARYYSYALGGHWLAVDPMSDKYPNISPYAYCNWNPVKFVDPDGRLVETAWDIANLALDISSLSSNIQEGNVGDAIVDAVGLAIDAVAAVIPFVPAGAGVAVKAARAVDKGKDVVTANKQMEKAGRVTPPNGGKAKPHGGQIHNAKIDDFIQGLGDDVSNIRKNQTQVDVNGKKVGNNRPDVQYDRDGVHYNVEFDTNAKNSNKHGDVIQHNDPNSKVMLNIIEK